MSLTSKLKDTWKYTKDFIKPKNIILTTAIIGATLTGTTKAQSNPNNYKPLNEIVTEGDNIIIPEEKYNEFLKNYKTKQTNTLNKITDITLEGVITDPLTTQPLEGINVTAQIYDGATLTGTYGPVNTDIFGHYQISGITDVEDEQTPETTDVIKYYDNRIETNLEIKTFKLYNEIGQEVINIQEKNKTIRPQINNLASGVYYTDIITEKEIYRNKIIIQEGKIVGAGKKTIKINKSKNTLEKINSVGAVMNIEDLTNNHHRYFSGTGEFENNNPTRDFSLIPKISLEFPITDPEYTVIPTINTIRDLIWYTARVQGEWQNQRFAGAAWPIKLYIDTTNAPNNGIIQARKVIQYFQDSLDIHPDSLIQETPTEIQPSATNGITAAKIIWTDSTVLGGAYSQIEFIFSGNAEKFVGANIYIDTNKVHEEDIGKYVALQLQKYCSPGGPNAINNQNYLGYTTNLRKGTLTRPNNDEKKYIKIGRNSKPYYINRVYP